MAAKHTHNHTGMRVIYKCLPMTNNKTTPELCVLNRVWLTMRAVNRPSAVCNSTIEYSSANAKGPNNCILEGD